MVLASGLEGVTVAETVLSSVDGEQGRLVIRGYLLEELAERFSFEEVVSLLWTGDPGGLPDLRDALGAARLAAYHRLPTLRDALQAENGMDALRAAVSQLGDECGRVELTAAVAVYAASWARLRVGEEPLAPDPHRGHAEDYLRLVTGLEPGEVAARAMSTYLTAVVDHGLNASTFAARVVASTQADAVSAVVAALGALKGPLHGGAPGPVLDMLDAIGSPSSARPWLEAELAAGRRIMGMGHRVYRVRDPRAAVLEKAVLALQEAGLGGSRLELARATEGAALELLRARYPQRPLAANVEFCTAVLQEALGIPRALFAPTFAVARVVGWLAHVEEERRSGRLIRPRARYVGPQPGE